MTPSHPNRTSQPAAATRRGRAGAWVGVAALLLLGACQAQPPAKGEAAKGEAAIADLRARITAEIGPARCSSDDQCKTLGVGERPCGGPEAFLPYSTTSGRPDKLAAWAGDWAAQRRAQHAASGLMSTCQMLPDPGARCEQQRCVLRAAGNGSAVR